MTDYYVNGNQTGGVFDKLPSNGTSLVYSSSSGINSPATGVAIGDAVQLETSAGSGVYNTFEVDSISGPQNFSLHTLWPYATDSVDTRYGHGDGKSEANAFPAIFTALANASDDDMVHVKWLAGGYNLSVTEQSDQTLKPGSGDIEKNRHLVVEGYKDVIGDMRFGQDNYQSAFNAYVFGIDTTKKVTIDGVNAMANLVLVDGVDNVVFRNLHFTNNTGVAIDDANGPRGLMFSGCFFEDINTVINLAATVEHVVFDDCFVTGTNTSAGVIMRLSGSHHRVTNCVMEFTGATTQGIITGSNSTGYGCFISNNLFLNGKWAVRLQGSATCVNNTFYNPVDCINIQGLSVYPLLTAYNNIFMPSLASGYGITVDREASGYAPGAVQYNDYNCFWSVAGTALTTLFYTGEPGGNLPVIGASSIEANPMLTSDYRPRNPLLLRGGQPDIYGNAGRTGAAISEHQFKSKAAMSNQGRTRIFR